MKRLILIRHAKSSWKTQGLSDHDRPLNKRGRNDAPAMGKYLAIRKVRPDLIISSPAKRAVATMKRIAGEIGVPEHKIVRDGRLYETGAQGLLGIVREIDDSRDEVILCGHNPALTDFCNLLSDCRIDNIPTCGVVSIRFSVDSWKDVDPDSGETEYFECPKELSLII